MTAPEPNSTKRPGDFAQRFATWSELHREHGPGRSYAYAWRLPELARAQGSAAMERAQYALALDLHTLGRFAEAMQALPVASTMEDARALRQRLALILDQPQTAAEAGISMASVDPLERVYLAYLRASAEPFPQPGPLAMGETDRLWLTVLVTWSHARQGHAPALRVSHQALARLRRLHPTLAAQAEAVQAESVFWTGPRWAPVWLDHALDQVDLFSQHHLKARLLGLKACALEAAGELREGGRFRRLAQELAQRQGARLTQRLFIDRD